MPPWAVATAAARLSYRASSAPGGAQAGPWHVRGALASKCVCVLGCCACDAEQRVARVGGTRRPTVARSENYGQIAMNLSSLLQRAQERSASKEAETAHRQHASASGLRRQEGGVGVRHKVNNGGGSREQQHSSGGQLARRAAVGCDGQSPQGLRLRQQAQALNVGQREAGLLGCARWRKKKRVPARGAGVRAVIAGEPLAHGAARTAALGRARQRQSPAWCSGASRVCGATHRGSAGPPPRRG